MGEAHFREYVEKKGGAWEDESGLHLLFLGPALYFAA